MIIAFKHNFFYCYNKLDCSLTLCSTLLGSAGCRVCGVPKTCCQQGICRVPLGGQQAIINADTNESTNRNYQLGYRSDSKDKIYAFLIEWKKYIA